MNRWRARFRRQRGPLVRYWDHDFHYLGTEPVSVETWRHWAGRQLRRIGGVR